VKTLIIGMKINKVHAITGASCTVLYDPIKRLHVV